MGIVKFIKKRLSKSPEGTSLGDATVIPRSEHNISRKDINKNALKILYRLHKEGYSAYLVGGCVRDLLLGRKPKDFDIATNAEPEQVKKLFRNCYLVGRRFRIAHVRFGREVYEVSTFRAGDAKQVEHSEHGIVVDDNVYGTLEDDAWRRDFTVNALYYNIDDFSIIDYTDGVADLKRQQLVMIGEPATRYREDPVRILRAIRFSAKLGFAIEKDTQAPIAELSKLLLHVAPARLFLEVEKLFGFGHAEAAFDVLLKHDIFDYLFPITAEFLSNDNSGGCEHLIRSTFANTDKRVQKGKPVTPAFFIAALLWHPFITRVQALVDDNGVPYSMAADQAFDEIVAEQIQRLAIPKRFTTKVREIWQLQPRLERRRGFKVFRVLEHPRFRAAFDFLEIRARHDEQLQPLVDWWQELQTTPKQNQVNMVKALQRKRGGGRHRTNKKPKAKND